ncbi:hypothetical protein [Paenibacillus sp. CGMCC 1.18879]|uniref:hypothetical protein n=1 Tax=Paenibacillus sp. CGMCC 1.18879 TaxID=2834466 RepID=UPI001CA8F3C7|nr:hypothetical protein [Paenibacillus sp. CGMCC 1.18879]MBY9079570.1 hypothetical protein [Paenibacillus sp. CGMCC 1.18879]
MSQPNYISFTRTDQVDEPIEGIAREFAEHFKVKRDYFRQFCRIIQVSKRWRISDLSQSLSKWVSQFGAIGGRKTIIALVNKGFGLCKTDEDINNLRGIIVESLLIAAYGGAKILTQSNIGWGAKVYIENGRGTSQVVRYRCSAKKTADCGDRATVDLGIWDGYSGKFFECKANPVSIRCKEISYMEYLRNMMKVHGISHETFFVCAESKDSIRIRLDEYGCSPLLKPIGLEELQAMIA